MIPLILKYLGTKGCLKMQLVSKKFYERLVPQVFEEVFTLGITWRLENFVFTSTPILPSVVTDQDFVDNFQGALSIWKKLPKLSVDDISSILYKERTQYELDCEMENLSFVQDYETKSQYG